MWLQARVSVSKASITFLNWASISTLLISLCPLTSATFCHAGIYGTPNVQDCLQALNWIPYARLAPSYPLSQQPHVFSEPQFLQPPFSSLDNPYRPSAIIQLPKIYKHSESIPTWMKRPPYTLMCQYSDYHDQDSCRVAIVSQGTLGAIGARKPIFVASWRRIMDQAARLRVCLNGNSPQGGYTPFQSACPL